MVASSATPNICCHGFSLLNGCLNCYTQYLMMWCTSEQAHAALVYLHTTLKDPVTLGFNYRPDCTLHVPEEATTLLPSARPLSATSSLLSRTVGSSAVTRNYGEEGRVQLVHSLCSIILTWHTVEKNRKTSFH